MFPKHAFLRTRGKRSSALVITLAALVLVCSLLLVFFNQSTLNRQISFSSAGQYRADLVAHTALDTIVGDLRTEVWAGSLISTSNNISLYIPKDNSTVVPCRVGDQGFPNLVKQSTSGAAFWTGGSYDSTVSPVRSAANNRTDSPSLNGRLIKFNQWNKPGLLGDPGVGITPKLANNSPSGNAYVPPDWIVVTRHGPVADASALTFGSGSGSVNDKSPSNPNYVIGRYAYTIYDEGGLLDINVAGFPSTCKGTDFASKRGLLPQVDLSNLQDASGNTLISSAGADALIAWRNAGTLQSPFNYTNYVFNATNGFVSVASAGEPIAIGASTNNVPAPGDQCFLSRKDLISYVQANSTTIPSAALPYLGTFSRALNAPTYVPSSTRNHTSSGEGYRFALMPGDQDDVFNPSLINTRVIAPGITHRDSDNTAAVPGEPLIKYRFPLSRLALFGNSNTAVDTGSGNIAKFFGLTRSRASLAWTYRGGASSILTLSQVAALQREPDFFELLQAAVSVGSLGKQGVSVFSSESNYDPNIYYQIIQIGANIIDQYDTDSFPTRITFNTTTTITGIENLPYLNRVFTTVYRFNGTDTVGMWFQPEIWNPSGQATTPPAGGPTQFRYVIKGAAMPLVCTDLTRATQASGPLKTFHFNANSFADTGDDWIQFTTASYNFSAPTLLDSAAPINATGTGSGIVSDAGNKFIGIPIGNITAPIATSWQWAGISANPALTHQLQYWDGSQWITYSQMKNMSPTGLQADNDGDHFQKYGPSSKVAPAFYDTHVDPRTDRFGTTEGSEDPHYYKNETIRPDASQGYVTAYGNTTGPGWNGTGDQNIIGNFFGWLSDNLATSPTHYADPDGVTRPADGAYSGTGLDGHPLATGNFNSRPYILNRPFRSVAEMGYAFRDEPWKSLDFFTSESADAALLDLFCVDQSPAPVTGTTDPVPIAGVVNLNSRQAPVIQTILTGALKAENSSDTISPSEAKNLAANLVALTTASPALNRSDLVTRWISSSSIDAIDSDTVIKSRREASIRALADVGDTRTWNLFIDVIAQSGNYTPISSNLNQFSVQGERRYWLHVVIDRYTGKVIAQSLESISD